MCKENLEDSLVTVISGAGGKDLLIEAAEFTFDAVLKDGILKEIPVVGAVAKLFGIAVGIQGYVFAKKVRTFLTELASVPIQERNKFAANLADDSKLRERVADVLVTFLDKLDDLQKAPLLARAFSGFIRSQYDFTTFQRLSAAIDKVMVIDLMELERLSKPSTLDGYIGDVLLSAGLASISTIPTIRTPESKNSYQISHLGGLFLQVVVKGLPRDE
jgi:hypothetical protein